MNFPEKVKGAIFDVDDTLLDNQVGVNIGTIHEVTRLKAILHAAHKYELKELMTLTEQENYDAFMKSHYHSLAGAVWQVLFEKGVVNSNELDPEHELLKEIIALKNELHAGTLRQYGRTVLHAVETVALLAETYDIDNKMAIASSAVRRDINIFLDEITSLRHYFPDERVISFEDIPHGLGKPHPEPFHRAFATLGLPDDQRSSVVAFDDDPRGIMSAKEAGLFVCALTTRFNADDPLLLKAEPDLIIEQYADIRHVIRGIS
ncbi:MAG TPA: HAD family hydrolase [Candidatus Saccharimonadales bacterium]|nr:HAD family hydrolase [Candidatus Saccharimonadales bacterium]